MKKDFIKIFNIFCISITISACGGGSGSNNDDGDGTKEPINTTEKDNGSKIFYRDSENRIIAYDINTKTKNNLTTTASSFSQSHIKFTFNSTASKVSNLRLDGVFYEKDGQLFHTEVSTSGDLIHKQITVSNGLTDICRTSVLFDFNHVFFKRRGNDKICNTADDSGYYVINDVMDENSLIQLLPEIPLTPILAKDGSNNGWIVLTNSKLVTLKSNFSFDKEISNVRYSSAKTLEDFNGDLMLNLDNAIHSLNEASLSLSQPRHTIKSTVSKVVKSNGSMFFNDGKNFYQLPFSGNSNSTLIATEPTPGNIEIFAIEGDLIIYTLNNKTTNNVESIRTINIVTNEINTLVTVGTASIPQIYAINGDRIYFNRVAAQATAESAFMALIDGTSINEIPNSSWSGTLSSINTANQYEKSTLILNKYKLDAAKKIIGGTLISYNAVNYSKGVILGSLKNNATRFVLEGLGSTGVGAAIQIDNAVTDIFYIDVNKAQSFQAITTSPLLSELPIY